MVEIGHTILLFFTSLLNVLYNTLHNYDSIRYIPRLKASSSLSIPGLSSQSGSYSSSMKDSGTNCATIDICPDLLLAGIFLAGAVGFYILYTEITMAGRRRKRGLTHRSMLSAYLEHVHDEYLYQGMINY